MIDFIRFDLTDKNEITEQYLTEDNLPVHTLSHISKVNILIGKNNSGKSRFMRNIVKNSYTFYNIQESDNLKPLVIDFVHDYKYVDIPEIKENLKPLLEYENLTNIEIIDYIMKMYFSLKKATSSHLSITKCCNSLKKIITSIKTEDYDKKIYIPILRGIEKFTNTVDKFRYNDTSFRLNEGERNSLNTYINQVDNVYANKVKKNYFPSSNFTEEIHTGEKMYDEIQKMLLGKEENRNIIKSYESFLSKHFFENKPISLIPNILAKYLYINIDGEEYELHNLGEGIKQLIVITYKMFIHKNEKIVFFIEEPELNLHPGLQRKLIELMLSDEFINQQYFITTHSNHLVDLSLDYSNMTIYRFEKEKNKLIKVTRCSNADNKVLQLIGAKPSSIFNSNCTIWVEGITDRLYIRKFLELYQDKLLKENSLSKKYREDIDYSFVEYSGGNITHWNFINDIEEVIQINAKFLSQNILVIADNDFPKEGSSKYQRLKKLNDTLQKHFYKLPVREIENLLTRDCLLQIVKIRENDENTYFKPDINCQTKKFIEGHIGNILDNSIQVSPNKEKHKYTYSNTNSLYNKLDFCKIALKCLNYYDDLSEPAKELTDLVFEFIKNNNKY